MQKLIKYLIWFGILILAAGFLYAVIFVNIPPQDPPEDVAKEYNQRVVIADWILTIGLVITFVGAVLRVVRRLSRGNIGERIKSVTESRFARLGQSVFLFTTKTEGTRSLAKTI